MLSSALIAGIIFSTYGIFARAQVGGKLASVKASVREATKTGSAAATASDRSNTADSIPLIRTSYSSMADGSYVGKREYAYYGYVQVEVMVRNGRISDVKVLEHPNDNGTSRYINSIAVPYLIQEAVQAQSANIDLVSGATLSSTAFVKSLDTAISKAQSA